MKPTPMLLLISAASLFLSACVAKEITEKPASAALAPMPKPEHKMGVRVVQLNKLTGQERSYTALSHSDNGRINGESSNGCQWQSIGDRISPSSRWKNCSSKPQWASGENRGMTKRGEIWPLEIGNTVSYEYELIDANGKSHGSRQRNCEVDGQVSVDVAAGTLDTFRISCKTQEGDKLRTDLYYFSPELAQPVKHIERRTGEAKPRRHNEYLRSEQTT